MNKLKQMWADLKSGVLLGSSVSRREMIWWWCAILILVEVL
jgi:hypothetical protein